LSSLRGARDFLQSKGREVVRVDEGYRVQIEDAHCLLAWAIGAAPVRMVCSDKARALEQIGPYMTRGLPARALGKGELFAQLYAEPWRKRFGKQLQMVKLGVPFVLRELELEHPAFDAALSDTLYALAEEVIQVADDLESITLEGTIDPRTESFDWSFALALRSQRSWFGQRLREAEGEMGPPPPAFWNLPLEATGGGYQVAANGATQRALNDGLSKLLRGGLEYLGIPPRLRDDSVQAFSRYLNDTGALAYSDGMAGAGNATPYTLMSFVDKGAGDRWLAQLQKVYVHPATRKTLEARLGPIESWPELTQRRPAAGSGLPATASVYKLTLPNEDWAKVVSSFLVNTQADGKGRPELFVVVHTAAGQTWLAASRDEQVASSQLSKALAAQPGRTFAQRSELQHLRQLRATAAGFATLREWLNALEDVVPPSLSERLEHRGTTPIFHKIGVSHGGKVLTASVALPKPFFADLALLVMAAMAQEGDAD
jgi:hypothetical protein